MKLLRTIRKRRRRTFDSSEVGKLLATARGLNRPAVELFIMIAVSTGLRRSEILHLQWSDVSFEDRRIDVRAKAWVERRWDRKARKVMTNFLDWRPKGHAERSVWVESAAFWQVMKNRRSGAEAGTWVFVSERGGERLYSISKALREVFRQAGLYERGELAHTFRRSVGTALLASGVDLETIRDVLGHEDIATTALYLHASEQRTRAAARKLTQLG